MKKIYISLITATALATSSCGGLGNLGGLGGNNGTGTTSNTGIGDILNGVLGNLGGNSTVNSLLDLVIGSQKLTQDQIVGTWHYTEPGCAFTSENLLAKAGGAVAAAKIKEKLQPVYNSIGVKSSNTYFTFAANNQFEARIDGLPLSGTYQLDPTSGSIKLNATLLSVTAYLTRTTKGLAFTFESKKLLSILQTLTALSGNSTIKTVGDLSSQFDGVRIGFNTAK